MEKKIFGNKKIMNEQVIFKRVENRRVIERNKDFGESWVYAYDLPYNINNNEVEEFIRYIEHNYGPVSEYSFQPYKSLVDFNEDEMQFVVPENFHEDSKKNIVKLEKIVLEAETLVKKIPEDKKSLT